MTQSDSRVPGRGRSGPPPSFGRVADAAEPPEEDFRIVGGQAFHLVLHVEATPTAESLAALYQSIRETTARAIRDGYAEAIGEPPPAPGEPPPGAGEQPR